MVEKVYHNLKVTHIKEPARSRLAQQGVIFWGMKNVKFLKPPDKVLYGVITVF